MLRRTGSQDSLSDSLLMTFLASNAIDDDHLPFLSGESAGWIRQRKKNICSLQKLISKLISDGRPFI